MFILESITIFVFFALLFVVKLSPKYILTFVAICGAVYFSEMFSNPLFLSAFVILSTTIIWTITYRINFDTLKKSFITATVCNIAMLLIQFWIPLYCLVTNTDPGSINEFIFGLPCRLIEYVILFGIYLVKVKPLLVYETTSNLVLKAAKNSTRLASIWWVYQPKVPKSLRKDD